MVAVANTKLQIEAVMSVTPLKMTEPRRVRKVVVEGEGKRESETYRGCYQVVLYYENGKEEEEYGWVMGGWSVESLARALTEYPLLAGRLQRREEGEMGMEIVSNDSGIRMVEARVFSSVAEFLESSEKDELENELVFWKDVDDHTPEFSPLFYVQVSNFECGGYSIGISCSLLLAEILVVDNFLKRWAEIHNNILPRNGETKTPIFYHPRLKNPNAPPSNIISRTPYKNVAQSMLFKITAQDLNSEREFAVLCVEEAEKKLHTRMGSHFSFFVKHSSEVIKVELCSTRGEQHRREDIGLKSQTMNSTTWDEFGVYEVAFHEGNRPVLVSRWIGSPSHGSVVAVPHLEKGTVSALIIVTPPS